ncbi:MAG: hypothetical protein ACI9UN_005528 [Granulosicoccus sp.]|jgi:hypothetical protein
MIELTILHVADKLNQHQKLRLLMQNGKTSYLESQD